MTEEKNKWNTIGMKVPTESTKGIVSVTGKLGENPQPRVRITLDVCKALNIHVGDKLHYEVKNEKLILSVIREE